MLTYVNTWRGLVGRSKRPSVEALLELNVGVRKVFFAPVKVCRKWWYWAKPRTQTLAGARHHAERVWLDARGCKT